ncbi:hypothetical protein AAFF_G00230320 [Aldrovandia affinis]|uniref:Uncharacterized protein n=1 Tax=Aldrovandia affinis TaxID=143900 RepID=A0AAD7WU64_9TELE|nr:hypothetical protein AAFF_G00230320 [Aldrovandia affinis]
MGAPAPGGVERVGLWFREQAPSPPSSTLPNQLQVMAHSSLGPDECWAPQGDTPPVGGLFPLGSKVGRMGVFPKTNTTESIDGVIHNHLLLLSI